MEGGGSGGVREGGSEREGGGLSKDKRELEAFVGHCMQLVMECIKLPQNKGCL